MKQDHVTYTEYRKKAWERKLKHQAREPASYRERMAKVTAERRKRRKEAMTEAGLESYKEDINKKRGERRRRKKQQQQAETVTTIKAEGVTVSGEGEAEGRHLDLLPVRLEDIGQAA